MKIYVYPSRLDFYAIDWEYTKAVEVYPQILLTEVPDALAHEYQMHYNKLKEISSKLGMFKERQENFEVTSWSKYDRKTNIDGVSK